MDGRLAGINTAIFSRSGGSQGIGFAIPSNMVATVVDSALKGGKVVRPWFGAAGQAITTDVAASLGLARTDHTQYGVAGRIVAVQSHCPFGALQRAREILCGGLSPPVEDGMQRVECEEVVSRSKERRKFARAAEP